MWDRIGYIWNSDKGLFDLRYQNKVDGRVWIAANGIDQVYFSQPEFTSISAE